MKSFQTNLDNTFNKMKDIPPKALPRVAKRQPPTVSEVATLAGVSPATVSRVFNSPDSVSAAKLNRVKQAAAQLGYQPYGLARSLRRRRSMVVGMVIPSLSNTYFAGTVELVQSLLAREGYALLLSSSNYQPDIEFDAIRAMAAQGVDGVILLGRSLHPESIGILFSREIPYLRCWAANPDEAAVAFDHEQAMADVVTRLLELGHKKFGVVIPFVALADQNRGRLSAIRETLARSNIALPPSAVVDDSALGMQGGRDALKTLMTRGVDCTAILCSNDFLAAGVIIESRVAGLQVPIDLSVTGYNATEFGAAFVPPIASVQTPVEEHATAVAESLLAMMREDAAAPHRVIQTSFIPRPSIGPARDFMRPQE